MHDDDAPLRRLRTRLLMSREFRVRPALYAIDLAVSASIAWAAGAAAVAGPAGLAPLAIVVAACATLRAAYFIHELAHLRSALGRFELAWNLAVGAWVLLPSFMADAHTDHHRLATYGTASDPEYEPVATWNRARIAGSIALALVVPALLVVRFGVLGPASWLVPRLRRVVWARMSSLQTNPRYLRRCGEPYGARTISYEAMSTLVVWGAAVALALGALPARVLWVWWLVAALALAVNQARTLLAHGYREGAPRSLAEQVADSATVRASRGLDDLVFVVGTRYHALHHLAPQLPYHALAAAHRMLTGLGAPRSYATMACRGFLSGLRALFDERRIPHESHRDRSPPAVDQLANAGTLGALVARGGEIADVGDPLAVGQRRGRPART